MQAAAMSGQQFVATPDKLANIAKQLSLVSHSLAASKFFSSSKKKRDTNVSRNTSEPTGIALKFSLLNPNLASVLKRSRVENRGCK
jgi:hypothetical protein